MQLFVLFGALVVCVAATVANELVSGVVFQCPQKPGLYVDVNSQCSSFYQYVSNFQKEFHSFYDFADFNWSTICLF